MSGKKIDQILEKHVKNVGTNNVITKKNIQKETRKDALSIAKTQINIDGLGREQSTDTVKRTLNISLAGYAVARNVCL